jgi:glutamate-1-semialdehyde 2,1-aminomutase
MAGKYDRSASLFEEARSIIPGGVNSPVRAFKAVGRHPLYFKTAGGCRVTDADGNELVDLCMSWGPLILGHADGDVVEAVRDAAGRGLSYGACHEREIELARLILRGFPEYDMVRLTSSGTEAVMTALRLARGFTGRDLVVKFEGCYHGHSDGLLVKAGSGLVTFGMSSSAGIPGPVALTTVVLPLDDDERAEDAFRKVGDRIAAVVIEPLPANNGLLVQRPEFLRHLRDLTQRSGALLVFDEVISGFRLGFGGYGKSLGIEADMVTLGKVIGGGMPVGALAARREIMETLAPAGPVYQAGTLSGNPVAVAAGIATLGKLDGTRPYESLDGLGRIFQDGLPSRDMCVRAGSILWLNLAGGPAPRRAEEIPGESADRFNALYWKLLDGGFYVPPSAYEVMFLSTAHGEREVRSFLDCLKGHLQAGS